jgi:AraC family transcriptional regulator
MLLIPVMYGYSLLITMLKFAVGFMEADIHTLYTSDFYRINDFKCRCRDCRTSKPEYNNSFSISFVRKGNFLFNIFRNSLDSYTGCVLVTKPEYERTVTHVHTVPDECTIFDFKTSFYKELLEYYGGVQFFKSNDLHSTLVKTTPETEFLHHYILHCVLSNQETKLEIDQLVMEVAEKILSNVAPYIPDQSINARLKRNHLTTIERAKAYITAHFTDDVSLTEIADHCHVSPFHFSRIFKTFTLITPHQFLLSIRLKQAELLLKNSTKPVMDVAFSSGFNSIEHFTSAFSNRYKVPPAQFREHLQITRSI